MVADRYRHSRDAAAQLEYRCALLRGAAQKTSPQATVKRKNQSHRARVVSFRRGGVVPRSLRQNPSAGRLFRRGVGGGRLPTPPPPPPAPAPPFLVGYVRQAAVNPAPTSVADSCLDTQCE